MTYEYCIVFDLDGVLIDSETNISWLEEAAKRTLMEYNLPLTNENLIKLYPFNVFQFKKMSAELGINVSDIWKTRNKHYTEQKLLAMKNRIITPYNDVNELYKLKRYSSICIISDSPQEVVDFFIKEFNYEDLFDRGIGRGSELKDLDNIKPNPYFYNKLIKYIESKKFIYVGDTEKDREFAHIKKLVESLLFYL